MSLILSNGYRLPQTGDFGTDFFPDLEFNIQKINDDFTILQNGSKGEALVIPPADFVAQPNGEFRALVSFPSGRQVDITKLTIRDVTTKEQVYLRTERVNLSQAYIFTYFLGNFEALFTA